MSSDDTRRVFNVSLDAVGEVKEYIKEVISRFPFDDRKIFNILLAVEEIVVNVIKHAKVTQPEITVEVDTPSKNVLKVKIMDYGVPFNPLDMDEKPNINDSIPERKIGGLGLFLVKKMVDDMEYERLGDRNCTSLIFKVKGGEDAS